LKVDGFNRKEVAGYLKISLVTLHDWMNKGLPHIRHGGRVLFLKSEVLAYV
jgi:excisionase family DNA binding protein